MKSLDRILSYLPEYLKGGENLKKIIGSYSVENDKLYLYIKEVFEQAFAKTATWGLSIWEKELGLAEDNNLTEAERRERIISRIRGTGTATIDIIKSVAESYDKGSIDVITDYPEYELIIKFIDTTGVPSNIEDMKLALRKVVPAHLAIEYFFNYFTWDNWDSKNETWDQFDTLDLSWDRLEVRT